MTISNTISAELIDLTPEFARELLQNNKSNRPLSNSLIYKYARAIKRGDWRLNGEPVIIFKNGNLGDGQHRCHAVLAAGVAIKTLVVKGVESNTFNTIDAGKSRTGSDVLSINGEVNTVKLAAATRTYLSSSKSFREAQAITSFQLQECIDAHPEIRYWVQKFCGHNKMVKFLPASFCGYMALASEKHGRVELNTFLEQLASGTNLKDRDPALVLRNRLQGQTNTNKLSVLSINAFIIQAINAHLLGKKLHFLRHTEVEEFPKIL